MANKNPTVKITKENAREMGARGGRARAENYKQKKALKKKGKNEILELWNKPINKGPVVDFSKVECVKDILGKNMTYGQQIILKTMDSANKQKSWAVDLVFDIMGFKDKELTIDIEPEINFILPSKR